MFTSAARLFGIACLAALGLSGCTIFTPVGAELDVEISGTSATSDVFDAAGLVIGARLTDAGIPVVETVRRDQHLVVRFASGVTDEDLATAKELVGFSASTGFRAVLFAGQPSETFENPVTEDAVPPSDGSDLAWITDEVAADFNGTDCTSPDVPAVTKNSALVACQIDGSVKYILGPEEVAGPDIVRVVAAPVIGSQGVDTGQWAVTLTFSPNGADRLGALTERLVAFSDVRNQFAIMLDGDVLTAPGVRAAITDGKPQISGAWSEPEAQLFAARLTLASVDASTEIGELRQSEN